MRIPTLFALTLLSVATILGLAIYFYNDKQLQSFEDKLSVQKIQVTNISHNSATISWQTSLPSKSVVAYGISSLSDIGPSDDKEHLMHFVNLTNLKANTKYQFRIKIGEMLYPNRSYNFKTATVLEESNKLYSPIRGSVLDANFQPAKDTLIILKLSGAAEISTITSPSGNFILPLVNLRNADLSSYFNMDKPQEAVLVITNSAAQSQVSLSLPESKILPPLITGQSIDLKAYLASSTNEELVLPLKDTIVEAGSPLSRFDLNRDGKINAVDLSIIIDNFGKNPDDRALLKKYQNIDFNNDNQINQGDIDLLKKSLNV